MLKLLMAILGINYLLDENTPSWKSDSKRDRVKVKLMFEDNYKWKKLEK